MIIEMKKRRYQLKQRAEQQQETRERIVDAAMALHEEVGPAATTISALAERAGVQRLTVYRHFDDEQEILAACSNKWMARHPPPDPAEFDQADAAERVRSYFRALFTYYRATQGMWRSLYRDLGRLEALEEPMDAFDDFLATAARSLIAAFPARRSKRLRTTVGHALRFSTWESLQQQGLSDRAMAALVCDWTLAVAAADTPVS
jgi:AcrR family transcriptional regulator